MSDSTVLLAMIKVISKHYDLPYDEILSVCNLNVQEKRGGAKTATQLEYIVIDSTEYLYDYKTNRVYSNTKKPVCVGQLCTTTSKLLLF